VLDRGLFFVALSTRPKVDLLGLRAIGHANRHGPLVFTHAHLHSGLRQQRLRFASALQHPAGLANLDRPSSGIRSPTSRECLPDGDSSLTIPVVTRNAARLVDGLHASAMRLGSALRRSSSFATP
jgi:hypothetical protein